MTWDLIGRIVTVQGDESSRRYRILEYEYDSTPPAIWGSPTTVTAWGGDWRLLCADEENNLTVLHARYCKLVAYPVQGTDPRKVLQRKPPL